MKKKLYRLALLFMLLPAVSEAKLFDAWEFYLNNGLRVVVIPNHKAPVAEFMVWYKAGSVDEQAGKGGLAHLLEHLMFRGTRKVPDSQFNDIITRNGGENNAFTTHDFTAYHEKVDISRLETVMALEADRMVNLNFSDEAFLRERDIVADERHQRIKNNPLAVFGEELNRVLWNGLAYGRPVSGMDFEIENLTADDVWNFYKTYYSPKNAVIVISGDINFDEAKLLVEKYFSFRLSRKMPETNTIFPKFSVPSEYEILTHMENIATPRFVLKIIAPSLLKNPEDAYALMLLSSYLSDGENSYFNQNLVLKEKVTAASAFYDGLTRGDGTFTLAAIPFPDKSMAETENVLIGAFKTAVENMTENDLEREKTKYLADIVYIQDNFEDAAYITGHMAALGLSLEQINMYDKNIRSVTLEDVKTAAAKLENAPRKIFGRIFPQTKSESEAQ